MIMDSKKAQIQIMENIGVLVIFFVLVILGMIFYFTYQAGSIEEKVSELKTRNALELASKVALLPELQCREDNVLQDHCFDLLKAASSKILLSSESNADYYFNLLGYSTIRIKSIYPNEWSAEIYNKIRPQFSNNDTFVIPVIVYDPASDVHNYGILDVSVYG